VNALTPQQRNIAQVFEFPVMYDAMIVAENLVFSLKNINMLYITHDQLEAATFADEIALL
jgi:ABC-type sugar transport system ATPase subunit